MLGDSVNNTLCHLTPDLLHQYRQTATHLRENNYESIDIRKRSNLVNRQTLSKEIANLFIALDIPSQLENLNMQYSHRNDSRILCYAILVAIAFAGCAPESVESQITKLITIPRFSISAHIPQAWQTEGRVTNEDGVRLITNAEANPDLRIYGSYVMLDPTFYADTASDPTFKTTSFHFNDGQTGQHATNENKSYWINTSDDMHGVGVHAVLYVDAPTTWLNDNMEILTKIAASVTFEPGAN